MDNDFKQMLIGKARFTLSEVKGFSKAQLLQLQVHTVLSRATDSAVVQFIEEKKIVSINQPEIIIVGQALSQKNSAMGATLYDVEEFAIRSSSTVTRRESETVLTSPDGEKKSLPVTPFPMLRIEHRTGLKELLPILVGLYDMKKGKVVQCYNSKTMTTVFDHPASFVRTENIPAFAQTLSRFISKTHSSVIKESKTLKGAKFYELCEDMLANLTYEEFCYLHWAFLSTLARGFEHLDTKVRFTMTQLAGQRERVIPKGSVVSVSPAGLNSSAAAAVEQFKKDVGVYPHLVVGKLRKAQRFYHTLTDQQYWDLTYMYSAKRGMGPILATSNHGVLQSPAYVEANTIVALVKMCRSPPADGAKLVNAADSPDVKTTTPPVTLEKGIVRASVSLVSAIRRIVVRTSKTVSVFARSALDAFRGAVFFCVTLKEYKRLSVEEKEWYVEESVPGDFIIDLEEAEFPQRAAVVKMTDSEEFYKSAQQRALESIRMKGVYRIPIMHSSVFKSYRVYRYPEQYSRIFFVSTLALSEPLVPVLTWDEAKAAVLDGFRKANVLSLDPSVSNKSLGNNVPVSSALSYEVNDEGMYEYHCEPIDDGADVGDEEDYDEESGDYYEEERPPRKRDYPDESEIDKGEEVSEYDTMEIHT